MVFAALVQRHHVATESGLFQRLVFDLGHDRPAGQKRLFGFHVVLDRSVDTGRDVLDAHQNVQLQVQTPLLLIPRRREEAILKIVVLFVAELMQRVGADVVVREDQTVGRDERPRSRRC